MTGSFAYQEAHFWASTIFFDELQKIRAHANDGYPPHNVIKTGERTYTVELAVAGFKREDLSIELKDHVLTIKGDRAQRRPEDQYVHRGLSTRKFVKSYETQRVYRSCWS